MKVLRLSEAYGLSKLLDFRLSAYHSKLLVFGLFHIGALIALFHFSWSALAAFFIMHFVAGCLGMSIGYHRLVSHRSFKAPTVFRNLVSFFGLLNWQGGPISWACIHRAHHSHTDEEGDPHSRQLGFSWAHYEWIFSDKPNGFSVISKSRTVKDLLQDKFLMFLERNALVINLLVFGLLALISWEVLLWGGFLRVVVLWHSTWLINSLAHTRARAEQSSSARNLLWLSLISYGEGLHGNHHERPASANFGFDPATAKYDLSYRLLSRLGSLFNLKLGKQ
jgi:fatty-acid desaturase